MEQSVAVNRPRALEAGTIPVAFRVTARERADQVALRAFGGETAWTWAQLRERVDALAAGLARLGIGRGDTVALLLSNRPEFQLADLAVLTAGATPFSVYVTSSPEQITHVVGDAGARTLICEQALLDGALAARGLLPALERVIVVDGEPPAGCLALDAVAADPDPAFDAERSVAAIGADDLLTLIYTSGTTGPPKGVEITHRNAIAVAEALHDLAPAPSRGRVISWLPAAHVAERNAHHWIPLLLGLEIVCCPDQRQIATCLAEVRPWWFFAVPRVWEKLKAALEASLAGLPDDRREPARAALAAALRKVAHEQRGEPVPAELAAAVAAADGQLFAPMRERLGLDRAALVNVGAAPTPGEVVAFFHAIGVPLADIWGMSESTGTGVVNRPGEIRIGTVGRAARGVEVALHEPVAGDDGRPVGELLVRGPIVMRGYRGLPEATAEAIDADGWLHTGDLATIDGDGYVTIVDRRKEIIINAAGKNMSPANIEAALKSSSPLIGQACVIGDGRPYNVALIVLDADAAPAWAAREGLAAGDLGALAGEPRVVAAVQAGVEAANARLSRVEQIKRFALVRGDWLPGGEELTPTMKLRRRPIAAKYAAEIEALYAAEDRTAPAADTGADPRPAARAPHGGAGAGTGG